MNKFRTDLSIACFVMKQCLYLISVLGGTVVVSGCMPSPLTSELGAIPESDQYRYQVIQNNMQRHLGDTFLATTFSGGGMRAATFAYGALRAIRETRVSVPEKRTEENKAQIFLIDEIDFASSVSGGSVTAVYWALNGPDRLDELEKVFLRKNVQRQLLAMALLHPVSWLRLPTPHYSRINILSDYFEKYLVDDETYRSLITRTKSDRNRPYLVLNATDMSTSSLFPFIQLQFDLLCADLNDFKLADAVAASAAYPIAFTALTLDNHRSEDSSMNSSCLEQGMEQKLKQELKEKEDLVLDLEQGLNRKQKIVEKQRIELQKSESLAEMRKLALAEAKERVRTGRLERRQAEQSVKTQEGKLNEANRHMERKKQEFADAERRMKEQQEDQEKAQKKKQDLIKNQVIDLEEAQRVVRELTDELNQVEGNESFLDRLRQWWMKWEGIWEGGNRQDREQDQSPMNERDSEDVSRQTRESVPIQRSELDEGQEKIPREESSRIVIVILKELQQLREWMRDLGQAPEDKSESVQEQMPEDTSQPAQAQPSELTQLQVRLQELEKNLVEAQKSLQELLKQNRQELEQAPVLMLAQLQARLRNLESKVEEVRELRRKLERASELAPEQVRIQLRELEPLAVQEMTEVQEMQREQMQKWLRKRKQDIERRLEEAKKNLQNIEKEQKHDLEEVDNQLKIRGEELDNAKKKMQEQEKLLAVAKDRLRVIGEKLEQDNKEVEKRSQKLKQAQEQKRQREQKLKKAQEGIQEQERKLKQAREDEQKWDRHLKRVQAVQTEHEIAAHHFRAQLSHYGHEDTRYVHLLDGGAADNLGFTSLLELLDSFFQDFDLSRNSALEWTKDTKHVAIISIDARSAPPNNYTKRDAPPGPIDTLFTTIGTAIDSKSFLLRKELGRITEKLESEKIVSENFIVDVSLDNIANFHAHTDSHVHAHIHLYSDEHVHNHKHNEHDHVHLHKDVAVDSLDLSACQRGYQNIPTNWNLSNDQIDALIAIGEVLVRNSEEYKRLIETLSGEISPSEDTVATVCNKFQKVLMPNLNS